MANVWQVHWRKVEDVAVGDTVHIWGNDYPVTATHDHGDSIEIVWREEGGEQSATYRRGQEIIDAPATNRARDAWMAARSEEHGR